MTQATIRAATDVGGTFTDLVMLVQSADGGQRLITAKADTTPPAFERGVMDVLRKVDAPLADIEWLSHGTTVVINAITERKGAKVGLITTEGFRDVLEIARGDRLNYFNLFYRKPPPFVPRYLRRELPGRVDYRGIELKPLDLSGLPQIVDDFRADGVEAVAICFLHSYVNDEMEKRTLAELGRLWPEIPRVASHQIVREWREYERTSTAVLSAYVQPVAERYLNRLETGVRSQGFAGDLYVMQSNCGVSSIEATRAAPIGMVESGPSSGFLGAGEIGKLVNELNVLALDVGGTTAKCSLIENGSVRVISEYWIERNTETSGYPIKAPVVDLVEIGNGGGSIAWVDSVGRLRVGPQSAGASPGPVAYGRGGTEPTTTDANLMLGRINPDYFCGGEVVADMDAVRAAFATLGDKLGVSAVQAARGVIRIANHNMVDALKLVSLNRGHDPRDFVLVAFGGGGGMHASALAAELNMRRVILPKEAAVFSAWGMLMADLRRDFFKTHVCEFTNENLEALQQQFQILEKEAVAALRVGSSRTPDTILTRYLRLRYRNQDHSVEVPAPSALTEPDVLEQVLATFAEQYRREYTYTLDAPVEAVGLHLVASANVGKPATPEIAVTGRKLKATVKSKRQIDFDADGVHASTIYDCDLLEPGMKLDGPAVLEQSGTTIVIHPGDRAEVDRFGNIHIAKE